MENSPQPWLDFFLAIIVNSSQVNPSDQSPPSFPCSLNRSLQIHLAIHFILGKNHRAPPLPFHLSTSPSSKIYRGPSLWKLHSLFLGQNFMVDLSPQLDKIPAIQVWMEC